MKSQTRSFLILLIVILILHSCKISYLVTYQTYLDGNPDELLEYNDSLIKVKFDPKPNGILFDIENLTKNNLYLVWDKSYFIEPDGSSSKALNQDILETIKDIRDKESFISVIPQRAHFKRYTCSSKNLNEFSSYNSADFYSEALQSINTLAVYSKFYYKGAYWYLGEKISYSSKSEIPNITNQVALEVQKRIISNNDLGMGLLLSNRDKEIEYHFKFPIKVAEVYKKTSQDPSYIKVIELNKNNNFKPIITQTPKTIYPSGTSIIVKCIQCEKDFRVTGLTKGNVNCPYCGATNSIGIK